MAESPPKWITGVLIAVIVGSLAFVGWLIGGKPGDRVSRTAEPLPDFSPPTPTGISSVSTYVPKKPEILHVSLTDLSGRELPLCGFLDAIPLFDESKQEIKDRYLPFCEDISYDLDGNDAVWYRIVEVKEEWVAIEEVKDEKKQRLWLKAADVQTPVMLKKDGKLHPTEVLDAYEVKSIDGTWVVKGTNDFCHGNTAEADRLIYLDGFDASASEIVKAIDDNEYYCGT